MQYKYNYNKNWVNNNFDIHSFTINDLGVVRHILENNMLSNSEAKAPDEVKYQNIIISGIRKNFPETIKYIKSIDQRAYGSHQFPFKVIVSTLNLDPQADENQEIIKKWADHQIQSWKNKGIEIIISAVHLNEKSVNLHIIANNTREKDNKLAYGWNFRSIKLDPDIKKQKDEYIKKWKEKNKNKVFRDDKFGTFETKQLHRNQEHELELFCKKHGLVYKQESTRIAGKSLSIKEYKELYNQLDNQALQDSAETINKLNKALNSLNKEIKTLQNRDIDADVDDLLKKIKERDEIIAQLMEATTPQLKRRK